MKIAVVVFLVLACGLSSINARSIGFDDDRSIGFDDNEAKLSTRLGEYYRREYLSYLRQRYDFGLVNEYDGGADDGDDDTMTHEDKSRESLEELQSSEENTTTSSNEEDNEDNNTNEDDNDDEENQTDDNGSDDADNEDNNADKDDEGNDSNSNDEDDKADNDTGNDSHEIDDDEDLTHFVYQLIDSHGKYNSYDISGALTPDQSESTETDSGTDDSATPVNLLAKVVLSSANSDSHGKDYFFGPSEPIETAVGTQHRLMDDDLSTPVHLLAKVALSSANSELVANAYSENIADFSPIYNNLKDSIYTLFEQNEQIFEDFLKTATDRTEYNGQEHKSLLTDMTAMLTTIDQVRSQILQMQSVEQKLNYHLLLKALLKEIYGENTTVHRYAPQYP